MNPVLFNYFKKTTFVLVANYDRSTEQNSKSNHGKNRQNFCNLFLKTVLPAKLKIVTGEIWNSKSVNTGQHDVIIFRNDAPSLEFDSDNTILADAVFSYSI